MHAPLALKHHAYMSQYSQLSVVTTLRGTPFDGFALCGFESLGDLKERFFSEPDSREVIEFATASLMKKLLHHPSVRLREAAEASEAELIEAARSLFGIDKTDGS